jgi:hypothetical protein
MKHYCPMCGEQWNDDECQSCGWREGKQARHSAAPRVRRKRRAKPPSSDAVGQPADNPILPRA